MRLAWAEPEAAAPATIAGWHDTLDAAERARADRFHSGAQRRTFIAAHGLARAMLAEAGGIPAREWRFVTGPHGRPEPHPDHGRPWLRFNISHTRGLVCCAVARKHDIGVDVEYLARRPVEPAMAHRWFAPCEAAMVAAAPADRRHETFLRIWTLKEAFIKATGDGIALGLSRFAFTLDPPALRFAPASTGRPGDWRFAAARPTPGHLLALALRPH
ncbi:4'-phosphopantetheinyl transferase family protein [Allostella humosa]|uniref:4'-phosphopantetheinyl transferase family protein n=1 Tax=Stella humosa TaxID=94 RepID=UPI0014768333|nr:4'-phosphopantetheinyl transferase superfamily protein [Stella humosa]